MSDISRDDYTERWYRHHAERYAEVAHEFIQARYSASHSGLTTDKDLISRMKELVSLGARGLDAGCGAGARDVYSYWRDGYDVVGVDAI